MKGFPNKQVLGLGVGLALAIQLAIGAFSYRNTVKLIKASDHVHHSLKVTSRLEDVLGDLTGDISAIYDKIENLRKLTADNPDQQKLLDILEPKVKARLDWLLQLTESQGTAPPDLTRDIALTDQQKQDLNEIRGLIREMQSEERELLSQRDQAARSSTQRTFITLFVGHAVSFGLLILVFHFLSREVVERQRAEQVSHGQAETLVKTLDALAAEPSLEVFSRQVLVAIAEQLSAHSASLWFYNSSRQALWLQMQYEGGQSKRTAECPQLNSEYSIKEFLGWRQFVRARRPVVVQDIQTNPLLTPIRDWLHSLDVNTMLCVPLVVADEIIGCIALGNTTRRDYQPQELELVQALARQLSLAIQLTRLAKHGQESAVLEERNRMAREIHDTLAQGFTGIVVQLQAVEQVLRSDPERASAHVSRAKSLARQSLAEARRSVWALRPRALEDSDLAGALRQLANQLPQRTTMQVEFSVWGAARPLPPEIESNLLRIGQEALTNVLKHADARMIGIELAFQQERVQLTVQDDGHGFDPLSDPIGRGLGLVGMRERARAMGGELILSSRADGGTQVLVAVPVAAQRPQAVSQERV